ncbi:MAG: hypothetical protein MUC83_13105 [Pirellula sp.]|nr:hypothetical protein [Pirellula sp.]
MNRRRNHAIQSYFGETLFNHPLGGTDDKEVSQNQGENNKNAAKRT